jgi:adenylate cyclase
VTLGFVGSAGHYEYRAVGDPVNTANRLQTLAGRLGVRIAVAGDFEAGVAGYVWRDLGDFVLRGRSTPLRVMELVGRTADVPEARQAELARFDRAIEHLRAGDREQARDLLQSVSPEPVVSFWLERVLAGTQATVMPAAP